MKVKIIGIDLAKETFGLHGVDGHGRVVVHKRVTRKQLLGLLAKLEPCLVGMEACGSAHHWARGIARLRRLLSELLADPEGSGLSGLLGETLVEIAGRLRFLDERIGAYDLRIGRVFAHDERCQRLAKVEGVGPLVATAMVAAVGNAREFKSGRELSA